jgi:hypothetical protein
MAETAVFCSVKSQKGCAKLTDPPQSLKLRRTDQIPDQPLPYVDIAVDRVFKYFLFIEFFKLGQKTTSRYSPGDPGCSVPHYSFFASK